MNRPLIDRFKFANNESLYNQPLIVSTTKSTKFIIASTQSFTAFATCNQHPLVVAA